MNYLTNYYKNLSEQLQERANYLENLLEARIYSPAGIRARDKNNNFGIRSYLGSRRAADRDQLVDFLIGQLALPEYHQDRRVHAEPAARVLRDIIDDGTGVPAGRVDTDQAGGRATGASTDDIKHVLAHYRSEYYSGSEDPEEQRLDAARQRTAERYS